MTWIPNKLWRSTSIYYLLYRLSPLFSLFSFRYNRPKSVRRFPHHEANFSCFFRKSPAHPRDSPLLCLPARWICPPPQTIIKCRRCRSRVLVDKTMHQKESHINHRIMLFYTMYKETIMTTYYVPTFKKKRLGIGLIKVYIYLLFTDLCEQINI